MSKRTFGMFVVIISLGIAITPALASTGHIYYSDGPWKGTVIDTETKEPIEGAVVVAVWRKEYGGPPAGPYSYFLDAVEVLTNKDGRFLIPKYWKWNLVPILSWIEGPRVWIFKPRYTTFGEYEYFTKYFPQSLLRVDVDMLAEMFKAGVIVELLKLNTREERRQNIRLLISDIGPNKLPVLHRLIVEERMKIELEGN